MEEIIGRLDALLRDARYGELEQASRSLLAQQRFYLWHQYLVLALLRQGRRDEAAAELAEIFTYKFNIADRAFPEIRAAFPERFERHFVVSTMKPEMSLETQGTLRRHWDVPFPLADAAAYGAVLDQLFADAAPAAAPLARAATRVVTFGSCFAANLARALHAAGVNATNLLIEESVNSPFANRAFLQALAAGPGEDRARVEEAFGQEFVERVLGDLAGADVLVVTLGVAPAFFHAADHRFAFLEDYRRLLKEGAVYMRTPAVAEIRQAIEDLVAALRRLNERARVYLTISPVPLLGTVEMASTVVADCVSKSTLRAALHEVLRERSGAGLHYWPAFEAVRWIGAHAQVPAFGADDRVSRHVSNWLVEAIVQRFIVHLFGADGRAAAAAPAPAVSWASRLR